MSAKMLRMLSLMVLIIGLAIQIVICVAAITRDLGAITATISILNGINNTVFLSTLLCGLSYLVSDDGDITCCRGISIITVLRSVIGLHACLLLTIIGLRIFEWGFDELWSVGAVLWLILAVPVFIIVLYVLSVEISKKR